MYNRLLDLDGEYDIEAALNTITEDFGTKVENTAKVIRSLEAEAKACDEELARLDRHAAALRPAWVLGENVPGIIGMALDTVRSDLEGEGYQVQPLVIPACAVGAPHRRDRVWIVGYNPECAGRARRAGGLAAIPDSDGQENRLPEQAGIDVADAPSAGRQNIQGECAPSEPCGRREPGAGGWWHIEPNVGRVANGIPRRVDRLRALGNAVVPQVAEALGQAIKAAMAGEAG